MSSTTVLSPAKPGAPSLLRQLLATANRLMGTLAVVSDARASQRLHAERIKEAAAVRDYALRFARHDPRFTADLMAAADRHEATE